MCKGKVRKVTVAINVFEKPFGVQEAHYSDVVFFTELSANETPRTGKVVGVKLPKWENIQDAEAASESSGQKRSSKSTSPLPKIVKAIKSQALTNLLAQFPSGEHEPGKVPLPGEVHISATAVETYWDIKFDGASGAGKGGAGITLTSQEGKKFHLSYKLDFECSNNEVKYKVLILGLIAAQKKALCKPKIWDGSKLVVKQTLGDFALKEPLLAPYRTIVQKLLTQFDDVQIQYTPQTHNRFPVALATLGANVDIPDDSIAIVIKKRITPEVLAEEHT
ncbi:uncharacterized protein LOC114314220 [Camellia sinensis]|uniref:uncharacterized protein LOC114314220 n=1 Tax=Camellia sinensis TaxID=4442 RepID=UPI001036642C|nr:uncharacterized protein LOC114314220 [Camellia sinensis]